jgi:hypothetical protein
MGNTDKKFVVDCEEMIHKEIAYLRIEIFKELINF